MLIFCFFLACLSAFYQLLWQAQLTTYLTLSIARSIVINNDNFKPQIKASWLGLTTPAWSNWAQMTRNSSTRTDWSVPLSAYKGMILDLRTDNGIISLERSPPIYGSLIANCGVRGGVLTRSIIPSRFGGQSRFSEIRAHFSAKECTGKLKISSIRWRDLYVCIKGRRLTKCRLFPESGFFICSCFVSWKAHPFSARSIDSMIFWFYKVTAFYG